MISDAGVYPSMNYWKKYDELVILSILCFIHISNNKSMKKKLFIRILTIINLIELSFIYPLMENLLQEEKKILNILLVIERYYNGPTIIDVRILIWSKWDYFSVYQEKMNRKIHIDDKTGGKLTYYRLSRPKKKKNKMCHNKQHQKKWIIQKKNILINN